MIPYLIEGPGDQVAPKVSTPTEGVCVSMRRW